MLQSVFEVFYNTVLWEFQAFKLKLIIALHNFEKNGKF